MPSRSAPSAKIFTRELARSTAGSCGQGSAVDRLDDPRHASWQSADRQVGRLSESARRSRRSTNTVTTCRRRARLDVAPAVADHHAVRQVEVPARRPRRGASRAAACGTRTRRRRRAGRRRRRRAAARCSRRSIASRPLAGSSAPRAMSGWLVTTTSASPAPRRRGRPRRRPAAARTRVLAAAATARRRRTTARVEHAVAVEEDGGAAHAPAAPRAGRRASPAIELAQRLARPGARGSSPARGSASVSIRTTGTSPFQPRSPPVYSNAVAAGLEPERPRAPARRSRRP